MEWNLCSFSVLIVSCANDISQLWNTYNISCVCRLQFSNNIIFALVCVLERISNIAMYMAMRVTDMKKKIHKSKLNVHIANKFNDCVFHWCWFIGLCVRIFVIITAIIKWHFFALFMVYDYYYYYKLLLFNRSDFLVSLVAINIHTLLHCHSYSNMDFFSFFLLRQNNYAQKTPSHINCQWWKNYIFNCLCIFLCCTIVFFFYCILAHNI